MERKREFQLILSNLITFILKEYVSVDVNTVTTLFILIKNIKTKYVMEKLYKAVIKRLKQPGNLVGMVGLIN